MEYSTCFGVFYSLILSLSDSHTTYCDVILCVCVCVCDVSQVYCGNWRKVSHLHDPEHWTWVSTDHGML